MIVIAIFRVEETDTEKDKIAERGNIHVGRLSSTAKKNCGIFCRNDATKWNICSAQRFVHYKTETVVCVAFLSSFHFDAQHFYFHFCFLSFSPWCAHFVSCFVGDCVFGKKMNAHLSLFLYVLSFYPARCATRLLIVTRKATNCYNFLSFFLFGWISAIWCGTQKDREKQTNSFAESEFCVLWTENHILRVWSIEFALAVAVAVAVASLVQYFYFDIVNYRLVGCSFGFSQLRWKFSFFSRSIVGFFLILAVVVFYFKKIHSYFTELNLQR